MLAYIVRQYTSSFFGEDSCMRANRWSVSAGGEQCDKPTAVPIDDVFEPVTDIISLI